METVFVNCICASIFNNLKDASLELAAFFLFEDIISEEYGNFFGKVSIETVFVMLSLS